MNKYTKASFWLIGFFWFFVVIYFIALIFSPDFLFNLLFYESIFSLIAFSVSSILGLISAVVGLIHIYKSKEKHWGKGVVSLILSIFTVYFFVLLALALTAPSVDDTNWAETVARNERQREDARYHYRYIEVQQDTDLLTTDFGYGEDKGDWDLYINDEFGFSFKIPPNSSIKQSTSEDYKRIGWGEKQDGEEHFSLEDPETYRHFTPGIWVEENTEGIDILGRLNAVVYVHTSSVGVGEIDGKPAFFACTAEGGGCSNYVVTEKFIFRLARISNVTFNEETVGSTPNEVAWPNNLEVSKL